MEYRVHKKENLLFSLRVIGTILVVGLIALLVSSLGGRSEFQAIVYMSTVSMYLVLILAFIFFQKVYLIAHMKGNGVQVSERQFADLHGRYLGMCRDLGIKRPPRLFILQEGGLLNAFAVRFSGKDYVAVFSDVFELVSSDPDTLSFVLAHELGHVKRMHNSKRFWTAPSALIPFLSSAYSRSCEYTCDNIGRAAAGESSTKALVMLAAGKHLYPAIDSAAYVDDAARNNSLAVRLMSLFMSHPYLPKRIKNVERQAEFGAAAAGSGSGTAVSKDPA